MEPGLRRRLAAAVACLTMTAGLSGCFLNDPNDAESGLGGNAFAAGGTQDGDGKVQIMGTFGGPEQKALLASLEDFEKESGIEIDYVSEKDLPTVIKQKAKAGDTPDIALFPQPGGLLELADEGHIQPIDTYLDYDALEKSLVPGFLEAARLNGRVYGAPMKMAVKSLVFYPKKAYEKAGYDTAPKSLEEMRRIAGQMRADGTAPWCMGWNDAQNTGWVGTDWIEEFVLREAGPDVYDEWVDHDIAFDDPQIIKAFDAFKRTVLADGQTYGGTRTILNTNFGESITPEFSSPPKCFWHRQGDFILSFLP
ncbi:MAG TPA: extracellular solute-binding protein, partial [Nocardioides sp.]